MKKLGQFFKNIFKRKRYAKSKLVNMVYTYEEDVDDKRLRTVLLEHLSWKFYKWKMISMDVYYKTSTKMRMDK